MYSRIGMVLALAAVVLVGLAVWILMIGDPVDVSLLEPPSVIDLAIDSPDSRVIVAETVFEGEPASGEAAETARVKLHSRIKPISGVILEEATGLPVEGVYVVAQRRNTEGSHDYDDSADTDVAGAFRLMKLKESDYEIVACHADYEEAAIEARPGDDPLVIHLRKMPDYSVYGTVQDDQGGWQPDIDVFLYSYMFKDSRQTRTNNKGVYEFKGVSPGFYRLNTGVPYGSDTTSIYFTESREEIEVVDSDLCIHFGADPEVSAWMGVLYDFDGKPVPGAEIEIIRDNGSYNDMDTNEDGGFYFGGLERGRYKVRVELPGDRSVRYQLDDVVVEKPGILKKDIRIAGAVLSGVVVDARTGAPVRMEDCPWFQVRASLQDGRHFFYIPDRNAKFCFRGVPSGSYTLRVESSGRGFGYLEDVQVGEGAVIEDLRVPLPRSGVLALCIHDYKSLRNHSCAIRVVGPHSRNIGNYMLYRHYDFNRDIYLEVGTWRLILVGNVIGRIEREFTIYDDRTTEVDINGSEY